MSGFDHANQASDAFMKFWSDMMNNMSGMGAASPSAARDEAVKHMRRAFFDAWAASCDEFMKSEQFLAAMKESMDGALAFKRQINEFLTKALHEQQMPTRSDADDIMAAVRRLEHRVIDRLDDLTRRVEALEKSRDHPAGGAASASGANP
ncbi:MAG: hypothetical protein ACE5E6_03695 [Phycisphaerae bacterium]